MVKFNLIRRIFGSRKNLFILWIFLVLIAKMVRYTVLKATLVDTGIGYKMLPFITSNSTSFTLFDASDSSGAVGNAAWFFDITNFFGLSSYVAFEIIITIIWNILLMLLLKKGIKHYDDLQTLFLVVSILALNIFNLTLAKEPVQILFFIALFYFLLSNNKPTSYYWLITAACILFSVVTFRNYYILLLVWTIALGILYHYFTYKKINLFRIIVVIVGILIVYVVMMYAASLLSPATYRELIRVRTRNSTAVTEIKSIFGNSNLLLFSLNYILVIIRMLFPIELIRYGVKYAIYVGVQLIITTVYLKALLGINLMKQNEKIALYVVSGFILMSGFFEPDFGSWIRHEMAIFPLFLILAKLIKPTQCIQNER
jgi:hypothetical protein